MSLRSFSEWLREKNCQLTHLANGWGVTHTRRRNQMFSRFRKKKLPERTLDEMKALCNIVFVDDHKFGVVDILKKAGWVHTKRIADIESLDDRDITNAHILFIDIMGVGKKLQFSDEGLGLLLALREKYPWKKLVVYSAETTGDRFHEALSKADHRLRKNADPYQFQMVVESLSRELFSLPEATTRIQELLLAETGVRLEKDKVEKILRKLHDRSDYSESSIARAFSLQNAASIATIVQLFLTGGK